MGKTVPSPQVAIIVVSYNTRDLLLACLASIESSAIGADIEIVVVDNASTDGSPDAVARAYPRAALIENAENIGFGAACNRAVEATRSPLILLLNSDAELTAEAFEALCDTMKARDDCGAAGCRMVNARGESLVSTRYFLTPFNQAIEQAGFPSGLNIRGLNRTYRPKPDESGVDCGVDWVEGACLMLRREAIAETGLFDERFFMYSEEEDLCRRLRRGGWAVCYSARGGAVHHGGASSEGKRQEMLLQFYKSQILFLHKHRGRLAVALYSAAMKALLTVKHLYHEAGRNERAALEFKQRLASLVKACSLGPSK
jgi:GT2 family glycosyltransferase